MSMMRYLKRRVDIGLKSGDLISGYLDTDSDFDHLLTKWTDVMNNKGIHGYSSIVLRDYDNQENPERYYFDLSQIAYIRG